MTDDRTAQLLERLADTVPDRAAPLPSIVEAAHAGRRRRRRRDAVLVVTAVAVALGGGVALDRTLTRNGAERSVDRIADTTAPCDRSSPRAPTSPVPRGPDFPTNASGLTYGGHTDGRMPDLVATIGTCGRTGYTYSADHDEPPPWVPGAGGSAPRVIPVYESDGVTQIDTFEQSPGTAVADGVTDPPAPADGPDAVDVRGDWTALVAGISNGGRQQYDTFRDLDLAIGFDGDEVTAYDGCRTWTAGFGLEGGALTLTRSFAVEGGNDVGCRRAAPLPAILDNVRHVTQSRERTYLHLDNFRIAVSLTRR
jgi:hypothetical protein